VYAGLGLAELAALEWTDVDLGADEKTPGNVHVRCDPTFKTKNKNPGGKRRGGEGAQDHRETA
jgi:hypothetical protein